MGRPATPAERNVAAEARAVEDGHHAKVMPGGWVKVVSDSFDGKHYEVLFVAGTDRLIIFTCTPRGRMAYREDHLLAASGLPGVTPCKHAALAARRLEREGLARYDAAGRWCTTAEPHVHHFPQGTEPCECGQPVDPWEGLPS